MKKMIHKLRGRGGFDREVCGVLGLWGGSKDLAGHNIFPILWVMLNRFFKKTKQKTSLLLKPSKVFVNEMS